MRGCKRKIGQERKMTIRRKAGGEREEEKREGRRRGEGGKAKGEEKRERGENGGERRGGEGREGEEKNQLKEGMWPLPSGYLGSRLGFASAEPLLNSCIQVKA